MYAQTKIRKMGSYSDRFRKKKKANFPHCAGAVDGKHIMIIKPENCGSMYFNYKDYFSVVLLAVADYEYRFVFVGIGSYGKYCDSTILRNSALWKSQKENLLQMPCQKPLPGSEIPAVPYVFFFWEMRHLR
jgi:hypothetical protein